MTRSSQEGSSNLLHPAIPQFKMNNLRRMAHRDAALIKILILTDDHVVIRRRIIPNIGIFFLSHPNQQNVSHARIFMRQQANQATGQILI